MEVQSTQVNIKAILGVINIGLWVVYTYIDIDVKCLR